MHSKPEDNVCRIDINRPIGLGRVGFLLLPFSLTYKFALSSDAFLQMEMQAMIFLAALAIVSGLIGYFMSKPCWRMYKNARDNRMLNDLRSKL